MPKRPAPPGMGQLTQLNRASPQATSLVCAIPCWGSRRDLVRAGIETTVVGTTLASSPPVGVARGFGTALGVGTTDRVATGFSAVSTARSIALWTNRNGTGGGGAGRMWDGTGHKLGYSTSAAAYEFEQNTTSTHGTWTIAPPPTGEWHRTLLTYDSGSLSNDPIIYLDGVPVTVTETATPTGTMDALGECYIGNRAASDRNWDGLLADFRVWDRILSPAEAWQDYAVQTRFDLYRAPRWRTIVAAVAAAPATSGVAQFRGFSRLADTAAKAATNTAAVRAPARLAPAAQKGGLSVAALRATGRQATSVIKGGLTTLVQRAGGRLALQAAKGGMATLTQYARSRATTSRAGWYGLVSAWPLDSLFDSYGSNTLTNNGGATFGAGKIGNAVYLDRVTPQWLSLEDSPGPGDIDFLVAAWVWLDALTGGPQIVVAQSSDGSYIAWDIYYWEGRFYWYVENTGDASEAEASTFGDVDAGAWHLVIGSHDADQDLISISVDGGPWDSNLHGGGAWDDSLPIGIGAIGNSGAESLGGRIDAVYRFQDPPGGIAAIQDQIRDYLWNGGAGRQDTDFEGSQKGATNTVAIRAPGRLAPAAQKGGIATVVQRAGGVLAAVGAHSAATTAVAIVRAAGRLAVAGVHGGITTGAARAGGLLASTGAHAGASTAAVRAVGRGASAGTHAGTGSAAIRSAGLLAALSSTARSAVSAITAPGRVAVQSAKQSAANALQAALARTASTAAKASSATANEQAGARLETLATTARSAIALLQAMARQAAMASPAFDQAVTLVARARMAAQGAKASSATANEQATGHLAALALTARSAVALLTALASQVASSVPTYTQGAALAARAWIAASGVKSGLSAAVQTAGASLATAGVKAAIGQARLSSSTRSSVVAQRDAFAAAAFRAQPSLTVVGVTDRMGTASLYARTRGGVVVGVAFQHGSLTLLDRLVGGLEVSDRSLGGLDAADRGVGGLEVSDR